MAPVSTKNNYTGVVPCDSLFAFPRPRDFTLPASRRETLYCVTYVRNTLRYAVGAVERNRLSRYVCVRV